MGNKHKHLGFIQEVINRMANHSFLIKGWTITLVVALFALSSRSSDKNYLMIAFLYLLGRGYVNCLLFDKIKKLRQVVRNSWLAKPDREAAGFIDSAEFETLKKTR